MQKQKPEKENFMTTEDAFKIVYELASQNILTDEEVIQDEEILRPEQEKQQLALDTVHDFLVNNIWD